MKKIGAKVSYLNQIFLQSYIVSVQYSKQILNCAIYFLTVKTDNLEVLRLMNLNIFFKNLKMKTLHEINAHY